MKEVMYPSVNEYLVPFACCMPVKGAARSLICDVQRHKYYYIPNDLFNIIEILRSKILSEIYLSYDEGDWPVLDEYFDFLIDNELAFITSDPASFPEMDSKWTSPSTITNAIIDIGVDSPGIENSIKQLSELGCTAVQLRYFILPEEEALVEDLSRFESTRITSVLLLLPFSKNIDNYLLNKGIHEHIRLSEIHFYNSQQKETSEIKGVRVNYSMNRSFCEQDCGKVCRSNFSVSLKHMTEALNFNTCLNKKISIDIDGYIKNCPTQSYHFGHVNDILLGDVVFNENYKKASTLKKDQIEVCKDCEYRYICTDCRIINNIDNPNLKKPIKCNYDPYTATWN